MQENPAWKGPPSCPPHVVSRCTEWLCTVTWQGEGVTYSLVLQIVAAQESTSGVQRVAPSGWHFSQDHLVSGQDVVNKIGSKGAASRAGACCVAGAAVAVVTPLGLVLCPPVWPCQPGRGRQAAGGGSFSGHLGCGQCMRPTVTPVLMVRAGAGRHIPGGPLVWQH